MTIICIHQWASSSWWIHFFFFFFGHFCIFKNVLDTYNCTMHRLLLALYCKWESGSGWAVYTYRTHSPSFLNPRSPEARWCVHGTLVLLQASVTIHPLQERRADRRRETTGLCESEILMPPLLVWPHKVICSLFIVGKQPDGWGNWSWERFPPCPHTN